MLIILILILTANHFTLIYISHKHRQMTHRQEMMEMIIGSLLGCSTDNTDMIFSNRI